MQSIEYNYDLRISWDKPDLACVYEDEGTESQCYQKPTHGFENFGNDMV